MAYTQTDEELREHLRDSVSFLEASGAAYDAGAEGEAKRIATTVRVLVHDTQSSKSLLRLLGVKEKISYVDTAFRINPRNLVPTNGLAMMRFQGGEGTASGTYVPPLDERPFPARDVDFSEWWNTKITKDSHDNQFSRRDFVLTLANKEGGAHVDPKLNDAYVALTRNNSLGFMWFVETHERRDEGDFEGNVAFASVRQVGHELVATLRRDLAHLLDPSAEVSPALLRGVGRNDACPCGSGRKFKKCHGT